MPDDLDGDGTRGNAELDGLCAADLHSGHFSGHVSALLYNCESRMNRIEPSQGEGKKGGQIAPTLNPTQLIEGFLPFRFPTRLCPFA
jgi:hypothetical protein